MISVKKLNLRIASRPEPNLKLTGQIAHIRWLQLFPS
jgi:hypothetical protein